MCAPRTCKTGNLTAPLLALGLVSACGPAGSSAPHGPRPPRSAATPAPRGGNQPAPRPAVASGQRTAAPLQVEAARPLALALGGRVTLPARWWLRPHGGTAGWLEIWGPERQLWLALVALRAESPETAIRAAWRRVRPDLALRPKAVSRPPASGGWDAVLQIVYVTPAASHRVRLALARGRGKAYYVALLDAPRAALGRRGAQLGELLGSLKAPGVREESFAGRAPQPLDAKRLAAFESFVRQAQAALGVVGAAVAVVQNGRVVYKKGFGVRKKGGRAPVTPRTLFMIGSITKTFTGMLLARLVDEKRFSWETPVRQVYPRFALGDPALSRTCQMQHTLCACTGLPRQDMEFLFEYGKATAETRMKLLATMRPTTGFGETFQYSNLLVAAAGYVAGHAAYPRLPLGRAYERALATRVLGPIGMRRTTLRMARARRMEHATPHSLDFAGQPVPIPLDYERTVTSVGPAGGLWSNVEDMARYALVHLRRGRTPEGRRVVSAENLTRLWKPGARIDAHRAYGLAMIVSRQYGIRILGHGGGTLGFSTHFVFLPDHDVALVTLHNVGGGAGGFNGLVLRRLLELLFGGRPEAASRLAYARKKLAEGRARAARRIDAPAPQAWIRPHLGTYRNPSLGPIVVRLRGARPELDAGEWRAPLARFRPEQGAPQLLIGPPLTGLRLEPGKSAAGVPTLTLHTAQQRYVFLRRR